MAKDDIITYEHLFTDDLKKEYDAKEGTTRRIYAIMEFDTEFNLGISNTPYEWVNSSSIVTLNGPEALALYVKSTNPMVEILDGESFEELNDKMVKLTKNFKNPKYVNTKIESRFY